MGMIARDPNAAVHRFGTLVGYDFDAALDAMKSAAGKMDELGRRIAPLRAKFYGSNPAFDTARKALEKLLCEQIAEAVENTGKGRPSQTALDAQAVAHPTYQKFVKDAEADRETYYRLMADYESAAREWEYAKAVVDIVKSLTYAVAAEGKMER